MTEPLTPLALLCTRMRGNVAAVPCAHVAFDDAESGPDRNSLEQAVLVSGAHLALIMVLAGPALSLLVSAAVLSSIGRVTFFSGMKRARPAEASAL